MLRDSPYESQQWINCYNLLAANEHALLHLARSLMTQLQR